MDLDLAVKLATPASVVVALVALFHAVRVYKRQTNAQLFIEYTRRYEEIMLSLPPDAHLARLDLDREPPPTSETLSLAILRYLNLCSEEFYLWKRGYLANEVWSIWEGELKRTLRSPLLRREWRKLHTEFDSYPAFKTYVAAAQYDSVHQKRL